ncbi:MAG TPA: LiaF domain-containing protein [Kofleriaceae bacterium]|nr:LiaF domain-containing protein [Kofleriaceae bacterium]
MAGLVAVRDRREQVIALLTQRFSDDVFDVDELDRRLDLAHSATSIAELDDLVKDLDTTALVKTTTTTLVRDDPSRPAEKKIWCVMSGLDRKGRWIVPRKMRVRCFWGGGRLDFREADFGPGVTEIHVSCVMGGFEIIVPPNLAVDVDASAIMGGFDERHRAPAAAEPGQAVLRITGFVLMGGVSIQTRLPGESDRQARKRERRERKQLRSGD